jgi:predicted ATPase/DNA-binding XRE family transcriptional regulator
MSVEQFGTLLRQYRLAAGLSQEVLAELALISADGISALERGVNRAPQRETLERLVRALNLDPDQTRAIEAASKRPSRPRSRGRVKHNLPPRPARLFGRDDEIEAITALIADGEPLTLVGAGGVGKTSLAVEAGRRLLPQFHDGVWFVDLASIRQATLVPRAFATVLGVNEEIRIPLIESLISALQPKRLLLIIDNCEHVVEAVATVVATLGENCPQLRTLATSRQPIGVARERPYRVGSLSFPHMDDLSAENALAFAAVALFDDRARRANQSFALTDENAGSVIRICRRLDGIALAIELAAARLRVLSPQQLEERLHERFRLLTTDAQVSLPRHKTMRALIDWSFDLLSPREQSFFARLGIFAATFTVEGACSIAAEEGADEWTALELLTSLVDKSLVTSDLHGNIQRYRLLESMRAYALERAAREREELERRHAGYYIALAERTDARIGSTPSDTKWVKLLEPELEDTRAALEWAIDGRNDTALGARLLLAMHTFWLTCGLAAEAARRAERALESASLLSQRLQAQLWLELSQMRGDLLFVPTAARDAAVRARTLFAALGDELGVARALRDEGTARLRTGDFDGAKRDLEEALRLARKHGPLADIMRAAGTLAMYHSVRGEHEAAHAAHLEVFEMARREGDERVQSVTLLNLAESEFYMGDAAAAVVRAYENLGSDALRGNPRLRANQACNLTVYLLALGADDEAGGVAIEALHDAYDAGDHGLVTLAVQHLAALIARNDPRRAARMLGYVEHAFGTTGYIREYAERLSYDALISRLRDKLDLDEIASLGNEGAPLNEDQVVRLATRKKGRADVETTVR